MQREREKEKRIKENEREAKQGEKTNLEVDGDCLQSPRAYNVVIVVSPLQKLNLRQRSGTQSGIAIITGEKRANRIGSQVERDAN